MSNDYTPAAIAMTGVTPNDGGDNFWAPRNIIAFLVIIAFGFEVMAPYLITVPEKGQAYTLILSSSKTVENVLVLVLGFFFGTTVNNGKKDETIRQALTAPAAVPMVTATLSTPADSVAPAQVSTEDRTIIEQIRAMITLGGTLLQDGAPNLALLNARLQPMGLGPIDAARLAELMQKL